MAETKRLTVPAAEELLGLYFPVLDHGFMSMKDYMGGDDSIEDAARGSYKYGTRQKSDQRDLIRYLSRHRHTSPTEFTEFVFHCCMPIVCARQWIRTRTASTNEMSGRYSLMPMLFYTPEEGQIQAQSRSNKQGRDGAVATGKTRSWLSTLETNRGLTKTLYNWATENDIARELARVDLPLSTYTQWMWKIDGHNLFHSLGLRCDLHAQWETRQYFNWMAGAAKRLMPISFEAWEDYHFYAKRFSRQEMALIRDCLVVDGSDIYSTGVDITERDMNQAGLGNRERKEFVAKFEEPSIIDFNLDLSQAKPLEFFEDKFRRAAEG